jgi:putative flippase GtrA
LRLEADSAPAGPVAARLAHLVPAAIRGIFRYGCVGLAISLLYSLAVIGCMQVVPPISPTVASVVAFIICLPVAYLAHRRISFMNRPYDVFQLLRFVLSTTTSFGVAVGGMYWITELAGRSYLLGIAWNWLIIPSMNFLFYLCWVFRTVRDDGTNGRAGDASVTAPPL